MQIKKRRLFIEHAPAAIAMFDKDMKYLSASRRWFEAYRVVVQDIIGRSHYEVFPDIPERWKKVHSRCLAGAVERHDSDPWERADGTVDWVHWEIRPWYRNRKEIGGLIIFSENISDLKCAEEKIKASLREKEVLLKEIHHRVKNNMQIISSLVSLQADGLKGEQIREVLQDVNNRVYSMALVHEYLYRSYDLARIDFSEYVRNLVNYIWSFHGQVAFPIRLNFNLQAVSLPIDIAVPCGLIINELVGNALKHAFKGRTEGEVTVSLKQASGGRIGIFVSDDGVGLPAGLDWQQEQSLGLTLVQMLTRQINAFVEVKSGDGTQFEVVFTPPSQDKE